MIIDTKNPPPPAAKLKTPRSSTSTASTGTINGQAWEAGKNYFENRCHTEIVSRGGLTYRELIPDKPSAPDDPQKQRNYTHWGCEAFAYKFDLPDKDHIYRVLVDYPDDDRRTMGFHLQDFPETERRLHTNRRRGDRRPLSPDALHADA